MAQAQVNRVRDVAIPAQRGEILDRDGSVLVGSTRALTVQIVPTESAGEDVADQHPPSARARRGGVQPARARAEDADRSRTRCTIDAPDHRHPRLSPIACDVAKQMSLQPFGDVTVKTEDVEVHPVLRRRAPEPVPRRAGAADLDPAATRSATLAAQVLGTVGQVTRRELKSAATTRAPAKARSSASPGSRAQYDQYLRGRTASSRSQINAQGIPTGDRQDQAAARRATTCRRRWTPSCSASARRRSRSRSTRTAAARAARSSR